MADNSEKIALLNQLLQNGQITQEMFDTNVEKLMTLKQNLRPESAQRATSLSSVMDQIRARGGEPLNISDEIKVAAPGSAGLSGRRAVLESVGDISESIQKPQGSSLSRLNTPKSTGRFGKTLKALGILGPAIGAMSMTDKAMAGDFGGAALEGADIATDYIPGVGQAKMVVEPGELGDSDLPLEEMEARREFNESRRAPRDEEELENAVAKRFGVLNKMK